MGREDHPRNQINNFNFFYREGFKSANKEVYV